MGNIDSLLLKLEATLSRNTTAEDSSTQVIRNQIEDYISSFTGKLSSESAQYGKNWFRPNELTLLETYLRRSVYSAIRTTRPVYNHLLIYSEQDELPEANDFAERIANAYADFWERDRLRFIHHISEQEFSACTQPNMREQFTEGLGSYGIFLIDNFQAENLDDFEDCLQSLGIGCYSVILCCNSDAAELLKNHSRNDYRLSKYLLRNSFQYTESSVDDIYTLCCQLLEEGGLKLSEGFRTHLSTYLTAVYPDAILREKAFVNDLLIRIEDSRADHLCFDDILTAEDVPYSRKAQLLMEANNSTELLSAPKEKPSVIVSPDLCTAAAEGTEAQPASAESDQSENRSSVQSISNHDFAKLTAEHDGAPNIDEQARKQSERPVNVLLLAMSTFPRQKDTYALQRSSFSDKTFVEDNKEFYGRGQLDPIPKKISTDLLQKGQALDYIVLLCTPETKNAVPALFIQEEDETYQIENVSPVKFFKAQIDPYLNPDTEQHFFEIDVADDLADSVGKAVNQIRSLANQPASDSTSKTKLNLFIDIHGGLRNTQMITQSVMSLLETDANKIEIQTYTVVNESPTRKYIAKSDEAIRIHSFVSGITELLNHGRTTTLHKCFDQELTGEVQKLMSHLDKIANGISWCDVNTFDAGIKGLSKYFTASLRESPSASSGFASYLSLFHENIKNGFGSLLKEGHTVIDKIRWCMDKGFYQQAIALIEAGIPRQFIDDGIFHSDKTARTCENKEIKDAEQFNACAYFIGDSLRTIKNYFMSNTTREIPLEVYQATLCFLPELGEKNIEKLRSELKTESKPLGLPNNASINVDFDSSIPDDVIIKFLLLHHVFKDLRNDSFHVKNFKYDVERLLPAIRFYLELCEKILQAKKTGSAPFVRKAEVGDICLAKYSFHPLIKLADGSQGQLLDREEDVKLSRDDICTVKITSKNNLVSDCKLEKRLSFKTTGKNASRKK